MQEMKEQKVPIQMEGLKALASMDKDQGQTQEMQMDSEKGYQNLQSEKHGQSHQQTHEQL